MAEDEPSFTYDELGELLVHIPDTVPYPTQPCAAHASFFFSHIVRPLPFDYISLDGNRLVILHFAITALDILNKLDILSPNLKERIITYIYNLQLPTGGFAGSPTLKTAELPIQKRPHTNDECISCQNTSIPPLNKTDSSTIADAGVHDGANVGESQQLPTMFAHLPSTYSALCVLQTLGDDLSRVNRSQMGVFLQSCYNNRQPGWFYNSTIKDECDQRFTYCVCAISTMLNLWPSIHDFLPFILSSIRALQSWDGAFSLGDPGREGHGGAVYTAVATVYLVQLYLSSLSPQQQTEYVSNLSQNAYDAFCRLKLPISSPLLNPVNIYGSEPSNNGRVQQHEQDDPTQQPSHSSPSSSLCSDLQQQEKRSVDILKYGLHNIFDMTALTHWCIQRQGDGYRGRPEKPRDCCYSFWIGATISLLGIDHLTNPLGNITFNTYCEGHPFGFGRDEDSQQEILHSFYNIMGLSIAYHLYDKLESSSSSTTTEAATADCTACKSSQVEEVPSTDRTPNITNKNEPSTDDDESSSRKQEWRALQQVDVALGLTYRASGLQQRQRLPITSLFTNIHPDAL